MSAIRSADARRLVKGFTVTNGQRFRLSQFDPDDTWGIAKERGANILAHSIDRLPDLQGRLYADGTWSLLLIFQAMDAAGKDSTISHVMSGVNPQGCQVYSFKTPSAEELAHDFLWRTTRALPERGRIGIFNRSYYEEVLAVRVHPHLLDAEGLPQAVRSRNIWKERFEDINAFERHLHRSGVVVLKFFLHVSKHKQKERFIERLREPQKYWKFSPRDVKDSEHWDDYMTAYEDMIRHTATPHSPWYVVPADHKWFTRIVVGHALTQALEDLTLAFPKPDREQRKARDAALKALER